LLFGDGAGGPLAKRTVGRGNRRSGPVRILRTFPSINARNDTGLRAPENESPAVKRGA